MENKTTYPKITIVTPNFNNGDYLEDAIKSVLDQGYPNLEYILIDGGSTDHSLAIIEKYKEHFAYFVSESDQGQYHAIQKGFEKGSGEIMAWLNSDDKYLPRAFFTVAEIFEKYQEVNWLQGIAREYTEEGALVGQISLNWSRWSKYRYYTNDFQFIQQETSFWTRELWEKSGGTLDLDYKLAGDMELWARFFRFEKLHSTTMELAGFRHRRTGQRSKEFRDVYLSECRKVIKRERRNRSWGKRLMMPLYHLVRVLFGPFYFAEIPLIHKIYPWLFGMSKVIYYDFASHSYTHKNRHSKYPPIMLGKRQVHRGMFKD